MSFAAAMDDIEDRPFSELKMSDSASISRSLTLKDIELFDATCWIQARILRKERAPWHASLK
jgi:hypothetical protein